MFPEEQDSWAFGKSMKRAQDRCREIANTEAMFGYYESAKLYDEMADEFMILPAFIAYVLWDRQARANTGWAVS